MKKLLLLLVLTLSVFTFAQSKEISYIYKNVITIENDQTNTFNTPVNVTYFYNDDYIVKVNFAKKNYFYTIISAPVHKYKDNLYYYQFNVKDSSGNTIVMIVFDEVGKYGCMFTDGKTTISYSNVEQ